MGDDSGRLVLEFARILFCNGQSTNQTILAAARLGRVLGLQVELRPRWGELHLQVDGQAPPPAVTAVPAGVDMNRVIAATHTARALRTGQITKAQAAAAFAQISHSAPAPTWLFALAAGLAAVALAVIYGVQRWQEVALIFLGTWAGAYLRRWIGAKSESTLLQPFFAALLAGLIGALAVRLGLSTNLRLVAVCPCMVLVPGPHFLNGAFDLLHSRIHLGAARLLFASLIVLAIAVGLLLGLATFGVSLPLVAQGYAVPLWQDMPAAAIAAGCFSIFYTTPARFVIFPALAGMIGHGLRKLAIADLGCSWPTGALLACLFAGLALTPLAHRKRLPFSAIGFAAVVSLMPGIFFFRAVSGLVQIAGGGADALALVPDTIGAAVTAGMIVMAMTLGLIIPKAIIDRLEHRAGDG